MGLAVMPVTSALSDNPPFAFTASQRGPLARPPLAIPPGTRLRGPSGSLRWIYRGSLAGHAKTRRFAPQTPYASFSR